MAERKQYPPDLDPIGNREVNEGSTLTFTATATDPNTDDVLTYSLDAGAPEGAGIDLSTGVFTWTPSDGPGEHTVTIRVKDDADPALEDSETITITVHNVAPTATFSNNGPINEGSSGTVSFSNPSDPSTEDTTEGFLYSYDLDNDGTVEITDSTSTSATVPATLLADGPGARTVRGRITDKDGDYTDYLTTITINNLPPVISAISNTAPNVGDAAEDETVSINVSFTDAGLPDTHAAQINWGDGTVSSGLVNQGSGSGSVSGSHSYEAGGVYTITATITDDDGDSISATTTAFVTGAGIHDGVLEVVGTDSGDLVVINGFGKNKLKVHAKFLPERWHFRTFSESDFESILIAVGAGNDQVIFAGNVSVPTIVDGGAGNDLLKGGRGPNVLIGGPGNDVLIGGRDRDVLIGDEGSDLLLSGRGEDLLIAGSTIFDNNYAALRLIQTEWTSERSYVERVKNLSGVGSGPRDNEDVFLRLGIEVTEDDDRDWLFGGRDRDWFFYDKEDDFALRFVDEIFANDLNDLD